MDLSSDPALDPSWSPYEVDSLNLEGAEADLEGASSSLDLEGVLPLEDLTVPRNRDSRGISESSIGGATETIHLRENTRRRRATARDKPPTPEDKTTGLENPVGLDLLIQNGLIPLNPVQALLLPVSAGPRLNDTRNGGVAPVSGLKTPAANHQNALPSQRDIRSEQLGALPERLPSASRLPPRAEEMTSSRLSSRGAVRTESTTGLAPLAASESAEAKKQKLLEKIEAYNADKGKQGMGAGGSGTGGIQSGRLPSQGGLASQQPGAGGAPLLGPTLTAPGARQPVSRRFHTTSPGDFTQRDYTYQFQGPRRYSVGEREYGNEPTYQGLPYYRRNGGY